MPTTKPKNRRKRHIRRVKRKNRLRTQDRAKW